MQQTTKVKPRMTNLLEFLFAKSRCHMPMLGEVHKVAAGVYRPRMPLPFTLERINLWLFADGDGWTIVDC